MIITIHFDFSLEPWLHDGRAFGLMMSFVTIVKKSTLSELEANGFSIQP
jgi:hypothetical protein